MNTDTGTTQSLVNSTSPWAIRLPSKAAARLASSRLVPGLQVLVEIDALWVRGKGIDSETARRLRSIPDAEWFEVVLDEQLVRLNETVPCERLPTGTWRPLIDYLQLEMPIAGFSPRPPSADRVMLKLVRGSSPTTPNFLRTTWAVWSRYATTAPQVRLNRLAFAVSDASEVLVRGTPLPPIGGRHFCERNGIVVPSGWQFEPNVGPEIVRLVLKLDDFDLAMFSEDGSFERLPQSVFVQASRSAVRMSHG